MSFAVIAPARRASSRLANKMLADIGGAPMIVRTLQKAQQSGAARVLAASDDDEVLQVCRAAGFEAVKTGEHQSGSSRIAEAAAIAGVKDDVVVNVQGDEPFIEPAVINAAAALLQKRDDCVCATAMRKLHNAEEYTDSAVVKVVADKDGCALYFSRAPIPSPKNANTAAPLEHARAHIGVYAFLPGFLRQLPKLSPSPLEQAESLEQLRILWHGKKIALAQVASQSFGIDTAADLARAQKRIGRIGQ